MSRPCDWCSQHGADDAEGSSVWLMGRLSHTAGSVSGGDARHQMVKGGRQLWACDECTPLVRAHDVEALTARARAVAGLDVEPDPDAGPVIGDASLPYLEHALIFRAIDRALVTELAASPEGRRPTAEEREAFARASGTSDVAPLASAVEGRR